MGLLSPALSSRGGEGEIPATTDRLQVDALLPRLLLQIRPWAALAYQPEEFRAGVDLFGVANWVRTLQSIPPYWESMRKALYQEIGDPNTDLDKLEYQIDECLVLAKVLDREGLESVISHLRTARNEVVWKMGQ